MTPFGAGRRPEDLEATMRYLLLIYAEPPTTEPAPDEAAAMMNAYADYTVWLKETGKFLGGEALEPVTTATTVSVRDDQTITTDGPFAETKEHLGGYYLIEAQDLDEAIDAAARLPDARRGRIEVRPIWETPAEYRDAVAAATSGAR
jgi:hypothetical protein